MADELETGLKISELPDYRGGFKQAVEDNAMFPVAIDEESNAKLGVKELSIYTSHLIQAALSGTAEQEDLERLKQRVTQNEQKIEWLEGSIYDDTAVRELIAQEANTRQNADSNLQMQLNAHRGQGGALTHYNFGKASNQISLQEFLGYAMPNIWGLGGTFTYNSSNPSQSTYVLNEHTYEASDIFNATWVRNDFDNYTLQLINTPDTAPPIFAIENIGQISVSHATNSLAGIVMGNDVDLGVVVDHTGKMSVKGLQTALNAKQNMLNRTVSLTGKVTGSATDTGGNVSIATNVALTKADVGLGNVDNTSDVSKPISTATQNALNGKQNTLTAGANVQISGSTISATDTIQIRRWWGTWTSGAANAIGDVVAHNNNLYLGVGDMGGNTTVPPDNTTRWRLFDGRALITNKDFTVHAVTAETGWVPVMGRFISCNISQTQMGGTLWGCYLDLQGNTNLSNFVQVGMTFTIRGLANFNATIAGDKRSRPFLVWKSANEFWSGGNKMEYYNFTSYNSASTVTTSFNYNVRIINLAVLGVSGINVFFGRFCE
ncbi:MAG: hypothetical protein LBU89_04760 [Fibromonadaceae bacterium]|jgi:hypothetical protein|nr:hypothetical protein [Fibromonadaceae bacterium]